MAGTLHDLLAELGSTDRNVRKPAAAYLGDWLAAAAKADQDVSPVAGALIKALLAESDPDVQEEIANSLGYLVEYGQVTPALIQPLIQHLPHLDPRAAEHVADLLEAGSWPTSPSEQS